MEGNTLKVYIVDDESVIVNWLVNNVSWEVYNCEVAGSSIESRKALAYLESHDVDILFTDISMPGISGLELIKRVKEKLPNIYVIVISAYDNFAYVREAFRYGIVNYCLKPIDVNEVYECLRSVCAAYEERQMREGVRDMSVFQNSVLFSLLNSVESSNRLDEQCALAGISLTEDSYQVALLETGRLPKGTGAAIIDAVNDKKIPGLHCILDGHMNLVFVFIGGMGCDKCTEIEIKEVLCREKVQSDYFLCIGKPLTHYRKIVESYLACYDFLRVSFLFSGHTLRLDQYPYEKYLAVTKNKELYQMANSLRIGKKEIVLQMIRRLLHARNTEEKKKAELICLVVFLIKNITAYDPDWAFPGESKCSLDSYSSEQTFNWLEKLLYTGYRREEVSEHLHPYVKRMFTEIHQNYSNKQLSLQEISKRCHVSPAYLGKLFKEQAGDFFNDYLLRVRLNQAERLLLEGTLRIGVISETVGFSNQSYFNKMFRKHYGISPAEYRRKSQEEGKADAEG